MPLPKKTLLSDDPILGGAIIGLAFGALAGLVLTEFAIAWCAVRLLRGKTIEVTAAAICAALIPALFTVTQLPHASLSANAVYVMGEVLILGCLALIGFVRWMVVVDDDPEDESEDDEAVEAARS
jgi:hypothetical protein